MYIHVLILLCVADFDKTWIFKILKLLQMLSQGLSANDVYKLVIVVTKCAGEGTVTCHKMVLVYEPVATTLTRRKAAVTMLNNQLDVLLTALRRGSDTGHLLGDPPRRVLIGGGSLSDPPRRVLIGCGSLGDPPQTGPDRRWQV